MASIIVHASKIKQRALYTSHYISLLESYTESRSLAKIQKLHAHVVISGLLCHPSRLSGVLCSNLASSYALCGCIPYARKLFDELPQPSLFLYNAVIRMYSQNGSTREVLTLFGDMLSSGRLCADNFTYPFVIKACGDMLLLDLGVMIHGKAVTGGFGCNIHVLNSLLAMYMSCGEMEMARRIFGAMDERDIVSWAAMISGCLRNGLANDALLIFDEMLNIGAEINRAAILSILSACGKLENLTFGRRVHAIVEEKGLQDDGIISNALIDMYARCGTMDGAEQVFDMMEDKDVVTWTSMINGCILNDDSSKAFGLCRLMQLEGITPNSVTIVMLLQACAVLQALKQGRCLHAWVIRCNLFCDVIVETALIDMYSKCSHVGLGLQVFTQSSHKRLAPWNAIISGYLHSGLPSESLICFKQMLYEGLIPDVVTFNSILPACGNLADLWQACNIHAYLIKSGFLSKNEVITGLIDAYSKCGSLDFSNKVFGEFPRDRRDMTLWSALIAGCAAHGHGQAAVSHFKSMVLSGLKPNEVTFTSVLNACSHAGLVDDGFSLFKQMLKEWQNIPCMHHYTCMVDLLGRAGRLQEAYDLIITMPFQPNHAVWGAWLGACVLHGNIKLGEIAVKSLIELEPDNTGNYVLLAKLYSAAGRWEDAENTRSLISNVRSAKTPGQSSVEVGNS